MLRLAALAAFAFLTLRLFNLIAWNWALVLAPITAIGVARVMGSAISFFRAPLAVMRTIFTGGRPTTVELTPPPDRLEPPDNAVDAGEPILAEHPEILAALCHGFRMKRLAPSVLGRSVSDPWGVFEEARMTSAAGLATLRSLAAAHTAQLARTRRKDGVRISDGAAMRAALDAFRPCAQKMEAGRGHPDCPYEHVTVIFGADSPNRDANLRSVAPRVRALLERQYPQLVTARLSDGTGVKFSDWQRQASQDRADLARIHKDLERQARTVDDLRAQLASAEARASALTDAAERQRREAVEEAKAGQARIVAELRAAVDRATSDHGRDRQRHDAELAKLSAAYDALIVERDSLERALFAPESAGDDVDTAASAALDLSGVRVLLVGGEPRQLAPLRERLEALGAQLLHDDSVAAVEHVGRVHVVIFWIRYLSHPTYFGVRQKVRVLKTPHAYWARTSPASLAALVVQTLAGATTRTDQPSATDERVTPR